MSPHPVIQLLASDERPPQRLFQHVTATIARHPQTLSELSRDDVAEEFLSLLPLKNRASHLIRLLLMLSTTLNTDKTLYSEHIAMLVQQLAQPVSDVLTHNQYQDLLCAALSLCVTNSHRWKLIKAVAQCGRSLETLSASFKGQAALMDWVRVCNFDGLDAVVLEDWAQRLVVMIETCPSQHGVSKAVAHWRQIETLKHALQGEIENDITKSLTSGMAQRSRNRQPKFDLDISTLFHELGLSVPGSYRVCDNHIDTLRRDRTLPVLSNLLESFPCSLCQDSLQLGLAAHNIRSAVCQRDSETPAPDDPFDTAANSIGNWRVVLSSRAYQNLRCFERDANIMEALEKTLIDLATGSAKSTLIEFKNEQPKIPLRGCKCRSDTIFLWQIDVGPGLKPDMEQQVIKVWAVGSRKMIASMISEITSYQKSLPDTTIAKCLEMSDFPKAWDHHGNPAIPRSHAELDIRLIDQEFIDTFNKSFTVTNGLLRSILHNDLNAEYPFDLSHKEMRIIQHFKTPTLILGRSGTGKTTCLIFKLMGKFLASSRISPEQPSRQILLTRSDTLAEKLQTYSEKLVSTLLPDDPTARRHRKRETLDRRTLFELDHCDFPLVCSYDQFLRLVENSIHVVAQKGSNGASDKLRPKLIDFKVFQHKYWYRLPQNITKRLSPHLVFSDIMGVIKGSVHTCRTLSYLELQQYLELSTRIAPNVTSDHIRANLFEIFERYEELKQEEGQHDTIDWVIRLLQQIRGNPNLRSLLASCLDEIYVDEVQDQRPIDIALMLELGHEPRGFHFGGDTAQAISQDSVFRFQDVKALFYDHFHRRSALVGQENLAQPQMFTLNQNYRSHQGILSMASSVMEILWATFPDSVDKLEPEVGTLIGPIPILFLDCDTAVLKRRNSESSVSPEHELLFGAEQVILARDDIVKAELVKDIGDTALILTVLQAKGMEFDDVILWDFFSTTPDCAGWRSLQSFVDEGSSSFDASAHAALCSELKHLYVAITRSRVRFLLIERSVNAVQPFIRMMNRDSRSALLEVTSAGAKDFDDKVQALQPRRSDDPHRWRAHGEDLMSRSHYNEACLCFRRAGEPRKEIEAQAYYLELQAEEFEAQGRRTEFCVALETAATTFRKLGFITQAVRVLVRLKRHQEAAELLYEYGRFEEAATTFERLADYKRASQAWHSANQLNNAILCLLNGALYDQMVVYIAETKDRLTDQIFLRNQRAVKMLLKQNKISQDYWAVAIQLVGSFTEQEAFYIEYEMTEQLVDLYTKQRATSKLFKLLVNLNRLEEALALVSLLPSQDDLISSEIQLSKVVQVALADRIHSTPPFQSLADRIHSIPPFQSLAAGSELNQTWKVVRSVLHNWDPLLSQKHVLSMDSGSIIKILLCLYITAQFEKVTKPSSYDEIPFELIWYTLSLIKTQQVEPRGVIGEAVLLLCGVSSGFQLKKYFTLRAWSPLQKGEQPMQDPQSLPKAALRWIFEQVTNSMLRVQTIARDFYRMKWPTRCNHYLVTGTCKFQGKSEGCFNLHEFVTSDSYHGMLEDLLKVNKVLCESTTLYYRRVMSEGVAKNFLGARRYWIEQLLARLTFVSAIEQDSRIVNNVFRMLRTEISLRMVVACMEDNLLYKARDEWKSQANLGYVLEQCQSAVMFGHSFEKVLIGKTRGLLRSNHVPTYESMVLLERLQMHLKSGNAAHYHETLRLFLSREQGIRALALQHFANFHCYAAIFERIAFYLMLQISQSAMLVPRSWLDFHIGDILSLNDLSSVPSFDQRGTYAAALILLLQTFVNLLSWMDTSLRPGQGFLLSGREYSVRSLQQRDAELLAFILVNYPSNLRTKEFNVHWNAVVRVFELPSVKTRHLEHRVGDLNDLRDKLLVSHSRYHGKNPVVVLNVRNMQPHPLTAFQKSRGLPTESLTALRESLRSSDPNTEHTSVPDLEQSAKENEAALSIQRYWRKFGPKIEARRLFATTEHGRIINRLRDLTLGAGLETRFTLFDLGVEALTKIAPHDLRVEALSKLTSSRLETVNPENFEALDTVLEALGKLKDDLELHHKHLSDESLISFVQAKDVNGLKELLQGEIDKMVKEESKIIELEGTLDAMI